MRIVSLTVTLCILVSCGRSQERKGKEQELHIDEELVTYVNDYLDDAIEAGLNTYRISEMGGITFKSGVDKEEAGRCIVSISAKGRVLREIELSAALTNPVLRKATIYHELSHCLFMADHTPNIVGGLLSPYMISSPTYYSQNWDRLVKKMFDEIKRQRPEYIIKEGEVPND